MTEVGEPERGSLHPLEQVVGCFGRAVAVMGAVPGSDLMAPAGQGPAERLNLDRVGGVLEVSSQPGHELEGHAGVGVVVDGADEFLGMPGGAYVAVGVAGLEQAEQLGAALVLEAFIGLGQKPAGPVEGVGLAAPMPESLVLDPTAALVETLVGQAHHMERIGDLHRIREHRVEHGPVGA